MNNKLLVMGAALFLHSYATEDLIEQNKDKYKDFNKVIKSTTEVTKIHGHVEDIECATLLRWFAAEKVIKSQWQQWELDDLKAVNICSDRFITLFEQVEKEFYHLGNELTRDYYWSTKLLDPLLIRFARFVFRDWEQTKEVWRQTSKKCKHTANILKEIKKDSTELLYHRDNEQNENT